MNNRYESPTALALGFNNLGKKEYPQGRPVIFAKA